MSNLTTQPAPTPVPASASPKFWPAFLLCIFLGVFGAHRFYLKSPYRILMLCTFGACGLWAFVDCIILLLGKFKDETGALIPNPKPAVSWSVFGLMVIIGLAGQGAGGNATFVDDESNRSPSSESSASSNPSPVGSYSGDLGSGTVTYIFKRDHTYKFIGRDGVSSGTWSQSGSDVTVRGGVGTATYELNSDGRRLGNNMFFLSRD